MAARTSDEAVRRATGKTWREWFSALDKAGAKTMSHRDIARWLYDRHLGKNGNGAAKVATSGGWWSQMVAVEYERARGKRAVNQNATGFLVAVHKTVPMPVAALEEAWQNLLRSKQVAGKKLDRVLSKTKRKMLRYRAREGGPVVSFDERGGGKSRIMVEAVRLPGKQAVERERTFWKKALEKLGGGPRPSRRVARRGAPRAET
jgi:hypothetical protein